MERDHAKLVAIQPAQLHSVWLTSSGVTVMWIVPGLRTRRTVVCCYTTYVIQRCEHFVVML